MQVLTSRVYREHVVGVPLSSTAPSVSACSSVVSHHIQQDDGHPTPEGHGAPFDPCNGKAGRGSDPRDYLDAGIELIALGCPLTVRRVEVHEMESMWVKLEDSP